MFSSPTSDSGSQAQSMNLSSGSRHAAPPRKTYSKRLARHAEKRRAERDSSSTSTSEPLPTEDAEEVEEIEVPLSPRRAAGKRPTRDLLLARSNDIVGIADETGSSSKRPRLRTRSSTSTNISSSTTSPNTTPTASAPEDTKSKSKSIPEPRTQRSSTPPPRPVPSTQAQAPSTPPQPRARGHPPRTPPSSTSSPKDLSSLFSGISPRPTPTNKSRISNMLSKSQSLGEASPSPSKLRARLNAVAVGQSPSSHFGSSMTSGGGGLGRTQSLPISSPGSSTTRGEGESNSPARLLVPITTKDAAGGPAAAHSPSNNPNPTSGSGGRAKRTYGRTRTILSDNTSVAQGDNDEPALGLGASRPGGLSGRTSHASTLRATRSGEEDVDEIVKESYEELRRRYAVDSGLDDEGPSATITDGILARAPQTASDMRSKGENRRFMDETGFLIDGLRDPASTIGSKRATAVDILFNMLDETWLGKLKICGQVDDAFSAFLAARGDGDEILDIACVLFLTRLLVSDSRSAFDMVLYNDLDTCLAILVHGLKMRNGPLDMRYPGRISPLVNRVREAARRICTLSGLSDIEEDLTPSTRALSSRILVAIYQDNLSSRLSSSLETQHLTRQIAKSISLEIKILSDRLDLFEKGLDLLPPDGAFDVEHTHNCLTLLSAAVLHSSEDRQELAEGLSDLALTFVTCVLSLHALVLQEEYPRTTTAIACVTASLKIMANMSNVSPKWAASIFSVQGGLTAVIRIILQRSQFSGTTAELQETQGDEEEADVDQGPRRGESVDEGIQEDELLCLVLAILTTGILSDPALAQKLYATKISATCANKPACIRSCRCSNAQSISQHLLDLYLQYLKVDHADEQDPTSLVLTGYLALITSKIIVFHPPARSRLLPRVPGRAPSDKIQRLLGDLAELEGLQTLVKSKIDDLQSSITGGESLGEGDTGVVEQAMEELRAIIEEL